MTETKQTGEADLSLFAAQPMFWLPEHVRGDSGWTGHVPFAFWLIDALKPTSLVEVDTRTCVSYFAFCQAVSKLRLATRCAAILVANVRPDLARTHNREYRAFSRMVCGDAVAAAADVTDGSVDLLHFNGIRDESALQELIAAWTPKLSDRAVVLLHHISGGGGAPHVWQQLSAGRTHFTFGHGHGLGVVGCGSTASPALRALFAASGRRDVAAMIEERFGRLGDGLLANYRAQTAWDEVRQTLQRLRAKERKVGDARKLRRSFVWRALQPVARFELRLRGKKVRPRSHPDGADSDDYATWCRLYNSLSDCDRDLIAVAVERLRYRPLFSIVMPTHTCSPDFLRQAIDSVRAQLYPHWELCIADTGSRSAIVDATLNEYAALDARIRVASGGEGIVAASNSALALATGDFIALMDDSALLPLHTLFVLAYALDRDKTLDILYSDEDRLGENGQRSDPYFKPDWDPELILRRNFVNHLTIVRTDLIRRARGFRDELAGSQDWDLILRVSALTTADRIRHLPFILYHQGTDGALFSVRDLHRAQDAACRVVADFLAATGRPGEAVPVPPELGGGVDVIHSLPEPLPAVSIIIPTRDRIDLLRPCLEGVLHATDYPAIEVVVVNNSSIEWATRAYFDAVAADPRVRILLYRGPFNYAAINNEAVRQARGPMLCFLNNDIEVIGASWLREMVANAVLPDVGAVGARLLYGDGRIQHGGCILGLHGSVDHALRLKERNDPGYFGLARLTRSLSSVTGACLVMRRALFEEVGGFDETHLPVAFNDIDLCLRLRDRGLRIVYAARAELYHHESVSRGPDLTPEKKAREERETAVFRERWGHLLEADPYYNGNLSLRDDYALAFPPRVRKPWAHPPLRLAQPCPNAS